MKQLNFAVALLTTSLSSVIAMDQNEKMLNDILHQNDLDDTIQ